MTVQELITALPTKPPGAEVQIWMPGSRIRLGPVMGFELEGKVLIEGNVNSGYLLPEEV